MAIWWDIDIRNGIVSHDSISWIDDDFEVNEDTVFDLSQDLLQVDFTNSEILDVGWYPDLDVNGVFRVILIKDMNWDFPIVKYECLDIKDLKESIKKVIENYL
ncbi:hypothetical protein GCM10025882_18790 [Acinetobacter gyllenbergii]|uniref:Uncharacterized protein n=1 Tax=Acinetobacter gyllenbergii CIP 110306 = MTCC 11365 TaxID=1217657 RepID=A0A829HAU2_9GAMM|nr:hypothetical protein [Acinetobacter gyllenbergii]EPF69466.1 hypothetical protein F957_04037 [Acinetobacter gyllenbergii CIP 110306 = MTCC 11365]EPH32995.1 hypothetical protein L293_1173 [Acinetobacter gyllenbergii CIP 110306 = MTCC 11365]ESK44012.1 hypothetical protein F987_01966 [Acinetobacter gyllenbergii NIPH 230]GMA11454.1 hypothetical protein GCM10025882_18790 [Acinetobacter gyllenbergii]